MHNHHITRAIAEAHAADLQSTAARNRPTTSGGQRHRGRAIVAALIAICALAPTAGAVARTPPQDLRSPDARDAAQTGSLAGTASATRQDLRTPDARDAAQTGSLAGTASAARQDLRTPDARDAAAGRGTFSAPHVTVVKLSRPTPVASDGGIDWGDVGIGAGGVLCVALMALGATFAVAHRRQSVRRTATTG